MSAPQDPIAESAARAPHAYRFGAFELHPASRQLLRNGEAVELQPKVFDLIAYLLLHRDRAVQKTELLDAVWPRQVVTEAALSRCVMKARRALDDDAESPQSILTVHGRGYRFMAAVEPMHERPFLTRPPEAVPALPVEDMPPGTIEPAPAGLRSTHAWMLAGLLGLVLALTGGWWWQQRADLGARGDGPLRVAVLPIENATGEERYDWARLGLMDALRENLRSRTAVVATSDVFDLEQALATLPEAERRARLREAHGATHVVSGRLLRSGGQLRLDYGVTGPDGVLRRRSVVAADVPALARAAGADLGASLGRTGEDGPVVEDAFANEAYLRGLALRLQGDMAGSQRYFELAKEQAPQAFWPRLQLARGMLELGDTDTARQRLEALVAEADRDGDPMQRLAARNDLAILHWRAGDNAKAQPLLQQALALAREIDDPDAESAVLSRLGILDTYAGRFDAARQFLQAAIDAGRRAGLAAPAPELRNSQAQLALREGDLASASTHLEAALAGFRLQGNRRSEAIALNGLANLRRRQGRFEEARDLSASTVALHRELGNPTGESSALISLALAQAQLGDLSTASDTAREAMLVAETVGQAPNLATAASLLGQFSVDLGHYPQARQYLQQAHDLLLAADDPIGAQRQRLWLTRLALKEGDPVRSASELRALLRDMQDMGEQGSISLRVDALRQLALLRLKAGDPTDARGVLTQALALAATLDDPRRSAQLHARLAEAWLAEEGNIDAAERELALSAPVLAGDPLQFQVEAALLAARGDAAGALAKEQEARTAAGQRWQAEDEARLQARITAAR